MTGTFKRDFLTGLVMLASLAGLVLTLWLFGDIRNLWENYYSFNLRLNDAGGLSSTSPVSLNGLRIGSILKARVLDDPSEGIELTLRVERRHKIPETFTVYIDRSFVGETTLGLEIPPKTPDAPPLTFVEDGKTYTRDAGTLFSLIAKQVKEPLERVGAMADDVHRLANVYEQVGKNAAALLEPRTPEQVDAGAQANLISTIARIDTAVANASAWLGSDGARTDFGILLNKGASAVTKLDDTLQTFKDTADNISTSIDSMSAKFIATTEEANATLRSIGSTSDEVRRFAVGINEGRGTLGQLANNPDLYNNANDAAQRLEKSLAEFHLLLEKYRTEGLRLQF